MHLIMNMLRRVCSSYVLLFMLSLFCHFIDSEPVRRHDEGTGGGGNKLLSLDIPAIGLNDLPNNVNMAKSSEVTSHESKSNQEESSASEQEEKSEGKEKSEEKESKEVSKTLDLGKLISSGKPLSIKTTETNTMDGKGNTEKQVKEIAIDALGTQEKGETASNQDGDQLNEKSVAKLVSVLKNGLFNASGKGDNSMENLNSPLSTAKGPLSKYPSINELSKDLNSNHTDMESANLLPTDSSNANQAPLSHAKTAEETPDPLSADSPDDSHAPSNETNSATGDNSQSDSSHAASNHTSGADSSDASQSHGSSNQSKAELTDGSTPASPEASQIPSNQIALLPVSLPMELMSKLRNALNGSSGNSGNDTSPSTVSLSSLQNGASPVDEGASDTKSDSMGESNLLASSDEAKLLTRSQKSGHGEGAILLSNNLLSNNEKIEGNSNPNEGYKRFSVNISYQEESEDN